MARLIFKDGVRVGGVSPETVLSINIAASSFIERGYDCVITAIMNGSHSRGSEHYKGDAVDLRTQHLNIPPAVRAEIALEIKNTLGADYDVIFEDVGGTNEHIHIEFDPKN